MKKRIALFLLIVLNITVWYGGKISLEKIGSGEKIQKIEVNQTGAVRNKIREHPKVAITFDDGPSTVYTEILLDGLKERGVRATFFLTGREIQYSKNVVKRMSDEGHIVGNHTYSHIDLKRTDYAKQKKKSKKQTNASKK